MQPRIIAGVLLTVAGLASFTAATGILLQGLDRQAAASEQVRKAEVSCREQLVQIGRVTPRANDQIEVVIAGQDNQDLADPRSALADATAMLAMCPGREILEACVGTTCGTDVPGPIRLTMVLGLIK